MTLHSGRLGALLALTCVLAGCAMEMLSDAEVAVLEADIIYGADDRVEYDATSTFGRVLADATALLDYSNGVTCAGSTCTIAQTTLVDWGNGRPLCAGQRFAGQTASLHGDCTAFLVGPRRFVTAGHCITSATCASRRIVFGFQVNGGVQTTSVPSKDVYSCQSVVVSSASPDYAVFDVDRDVDRVPFWVRYNDVTLPPLVLGDKMTMIGYPSGLPLKVDAGGRVKTLSPTSYTANSDSFGGNSGSPVVERYRNVVEGILASGNTDYVVNGACSVVNTCSDGAGCPGFEIHTRITQATSHIPLHPAGTFITVVQPT